MPGDVPAGYLPIIREYVDRETGERSRSLADLAVARGRVTLDGTYTGTKREIIAGKTLFREITVSRPSLPADFRRLSRQRNFRPFDIPALIEGFTRAIERAWDPKKFHVVAHSSGYDSRVLSAVLAGLRERRGREWLGRVLFLCSEPEGEVFREIMSAGGWRADEYLVCNEGARPGEYYAGVLEFENCWRWPNDAQPPIFIIPWTIARLREEGVVPRSEIQYLGGGGGNECLTDGLGELQEKFFQGPLMGCVTSIPGSEIIMPFMSLDVLRHITPRVRATALFSTHLFKLRKSLGRRFLNLAGKKRPEPVSGNLAVRIAMLRKLSPGVAALEKKTEDAPASWQRRLSPDLREKCRASLASSRYRAEIAGREEFPGPGDVPSTLWTQPWWSMYAKAEPFPKNWTVLIGVF